MSMIHLVNRADNTPICGNKGTELTVTTHPTETTCGRCKMVAAARAKKAAAEAQAQAEVAQAQAELVEAAAEPVEIKAAAQPGRCECSRYYYRVGQHLYTTNCHKSPNGKRSRFAQGHDQKLLSLRKHAEAAGRQLEIMDIGA